MPTPRRAIAAWVLYDWAFGAFNTVVTTFVFATYFTQKVHPIFLPTHPNEYSRYYSISCLDWLKIYPKRT